MNSMQTDPKQYISQIQQYLSDAKKPLALLLGAGCPMAIYGQTDEPLIPGIAEMTKHVQKELNASEEHKDSFCTVQNNLKADGNDTPTVEDMLTHIRALRAIVGSDKVRGLRAEQLDNLDTAICDHIYEIVDKKLPGTETPYHHIASWAKAIFREKPVEIFTTNYDLLMEQAFENIRAPYFDGFSGVQRPRFNYQTMEKDGLPSHWSRLWKLHGSINWYQDMAQDVFRGTTSEEGQRRLIHPSHLKHQESRRMPYLAMFDRLQTFSKNPTAALTICGYSFNDEHINETITQGLQYTQTAVAFALLYGPGKTYQKAFELAKKQPNLNVLALDGGIIGGQEIKWFEKDKESLPTNASEWIQWENSTDDKKKKVAKLTLGDFKMFGLFLKELVGTT